MIFMGQTPRKPRNECDECQASLGPDDGGLCVWCAQRYEADINNEWWN